MCMHACMQLYSAPNLEPSSSRAAALQTDGAPASVRMNACQIHVYWPLKCSLHANNRGYTNTSAVKSAISYIDGDRGILRYRGYPIEQLAERSNFTEVNPYSSLIALEQLTTNAGAGPCILNPTQSHWSM